MTYFLKAQVVGSGESVCRSFFEICCLKTLCSAVCFYILLLSFSDLCWFAASMLPLYRLFLSCSFKSSLFESGRLSSAPLRRLNDAEVFKSLQSRWKTNLHSYMIKIGYNIGLVVLFRHLN